MQGKVFTGVYIQYGRRVSRGTRLYTGLALCIANRSILPQG